ncbi:MAG TPA: FtsQ-type POTRA domain-containing protein [Candidatus Gallacutalibacter stercoravium]|nr:FtsQ-type POTRA domain-containing protein [Candidatus Gallacutalibacter stercoravium]
MTKKNTVNQQRQKVVHRPAQDDRRRHLSPRKSARSRKVRLWLLYGFLILAVLGVALALSLTVLFKIDTITVEGETRYDSAQVIELSGIEQGQNLFLCKAKEGAASIENALPYVETVEISRRIPNKIVITVKEATPSGVISQQDGYVIISSQGKVLEVADQPKEDLPIIKGIQLENAQPGSSVQFEDQNAQEVLQSITQAIERNQMEKVTEIDLTNITSPTLTYDNRVLVKLGLPTTPEEMDYKIRFAINCLQPPNIGEEEEGVLDVSLAVSDNMAPFRISDINAASNISE